MKRTVPMCLDDNIVNLLDESGNRSGTANRIISEYFNKHRPIKEVKEEKLKEAEKLLDEANDLAVIEEKARIEREKREKEMNVEKSKELEEKAAERLIKKKLMARESLLLYEIEPEKFEEAFELFWKMLEEGRVRGAMEFAQLNNLQRKPDRREGAIRSSIF